MNWLRDAAFLIQEINGGRVKILVGENSPLKLKTQVIYQHLQLNDQASYKLDLMPSMRGLVYVMRAELEVKRQKVDTDQAIFVEHQNHLNFIADGETQFMICMGQPHGEAIHQHEPFVD